MKFGMRLPSRGPMTQPDALVALTERAEKLGFHALAVSDHIVLPVQVSSSYPYTRTGDLPPRGLGGALEQLTTLSFVAAKTTRLRLLTSVMVLPHRSPLLAAKILATIDVLSKGRLTVGVGVGWMKEEFEALGLPPFSDRGSVSDEYIRIFKEVWTNEIPTFEGRYSRFSGARFDPSPIQKPHPPIWVGGESPRAMRRAAEIGDGWYPIGSNPRFPLGTLDQMQAAVSRLKGYVERVGRSPTDLEVGYVVPKYELVKTASSSGESDGIFVGDSEKIARNILNFEQLGVSYLGFEFQRPEVEETLERMDEFASEIVARVNEV